MEERFPCFDRLLVLQAQRSQVHFRGRSRRLSPRLSSRLGALRQERVGLTMANDAHQGVAIDKGVEDAAGETEAADRIVRLCVGESAEKQIGCNARARCIRVTRHQPARLSPSSPALRTAVGSYTAPLS